MFTCLTLTPRLNFQLTMKNTQKKFFDTVTANIGTVRTQETNVVVELYPENEEPPTSEPRHEHDSHPAGTQLSGKLSHLRAGAARLGMPIARRKLP